VQKNPLVLKQNEIAVMPNGEIIRGPDGPDKLINVPPSATVYDTRTNKPLYTAPARPQTNAQKLSSGDEGALREQAKAITTKAFPPEQALEYEKGYYGQAYPKRAAEMGVTPQIEAQARQGIPAAIQKVKAAQTAAEQDAKQIALQGRQQWESMVHGILRDAKLKGVQIPTGQVFKQDDVAKIMQGQHIGYWDAVRLVRAFGNDVEPMPGQGQPSLADRLTNVDGAR
jgi:hypothetical protein